ncbi:hypothetical protein PVAP13_4KG118110 [Panicum virgatum]|uniref:Uncharacterized protein n=1 Tax=Panicum virgatum TaxID=38727 RepID=A0A8T0TPQ5_PANVG|nr:hypothetical protein PVAP13_4KG118110 [Panicum virgatum]
MSRRHADMKARAWGRSGRDGSRRGGEKEPTQRGAVRWAGRARGIQRARGRTSAAIRPANGSRRCSSTPQIRLLALETLKKKPAADKGAKPAAREGERKPEVFWPPCPSPRSPGPTSRTTTTKTTSPPPRRRPGPSGERQPRRRQGPARRARPGRGPAAGTKGSKKVVQQSPRAQVQWKISCSIA